MQRLWLTLFRVNTLLNGNAKKVKNDISERIRIGMQNSGFILSTACSIAPKVKKENIQILSEIVLDIGNYNK